MRASSSSSIASFGYNRSSSILPVRPYALNNRPFTIEPYLAIVAVIVKKTDPAVLGLLVIVFSILGVATILEDRTLEPWPARFGAPTDTIFSMDSLEELPDSLPILSKSKVDSISSIFPISPFTPSSTAEKNYSFDVSFPFSAVITRRALRVDRSFRLRSTVSAR